MLTTRGRADNVIAGIDVIGLLAVSQQGLETLLSLGDKGNLMQPQKNRLNVSLDGVVFIKRLL